LNSRFLHGKFVYESNGCEAHTAYSERKPFRVSGFLFIRQEG
jgi:hypothetical protein